MTKTVRILILDESEQDAQSVITELRNSDIPVLIQRASNRTDFENACRDFKPDLVLSDYAMTGFDGLSAMEYVRLQYPEVPFIFVSWVIHEESVIDTLKKGATDYVFKDQLSRLPLSVHRAVREAEERSQLRATQKKIIEQERLGAIGQMASGIAHDFSNALMPVLGFAEIMLKKNGPEDKEKSQRYLSLIHTSATDAMNIVGRLREFYRSKDKAESLGAVDLNELVRQTVLMTQPRWKTEKLGKGIQINVHEDLDALPAIHGNETALREALTNLIFNAVDAMPKGGELVFQTRIEDEKAVLTVSDTGAGMTDETARRCFEPFFSTKGRGGTGLGLSMVYGVVKRHEGSIDVKSELKKGTAFILRFPLKRHLTVIDAATPTGPSPEVLSAIPKLHALVVDDEAPIHDVLLGYLALDGHTGVAAGHGRDGLEVFKNGTFDLVVTDRAMPEMNGDEMADRIRKIAPDVPIIMVTGFGELMKVKGEHPKSVDVVLSKPLTLVAWRTALAKVFSARPTPS